MDLSAIVRGINEKFGTCYASLDRFDVGEQGAYLISDPSGNPFVLKWSDSREGTSYLKSAMTFTQMLKNLDYPLPAYIHMGEACGGVYTVQERLPGHPLHALTPSLLPKLIEINTLQMDKIHDATPSDWASTIIGSIVYGGDGFCLPETLENYSSSSRELLDIIQNIAYMNSEIKFRSSDIVHFDMNPGNILVEQGQISGIIDWQAPRIGDCTFDLITVMYYSYTEQQVCHSLWKHALDRVGFNASSVYLAHMILRQVDWSIRHNEAYAAHWIDVSKRALENVEIRRK